MKNYVLRTGLIWVVAGLPGLAVAGPAIAPMGPRVAAVGYQESRVEPPLPAPVLAAVNPAAPGPAGVAPAPRGRLQIGVGRMFASPVQLNRTAPAPDWQVLPNGWRLWSAEVISQGAVGIRLHLEKVALPEGVRVLAYDPAHPARFTRPILADDVPAEREIWTETLYAERIVLECQVPPEADAQAVAFSITGLSHLFRSPRDAFGTLQRAGACNNDVSCYPAYAQQAAGVARISFVDAGTSYLCTGCLLSDSAPNSQVNYFLTANHCVHSQLIASTVEFDWLDQTSTCNGSPPVNWPRTGGGANLLAASATSDFAFMRLRQSPPDGVYRLAWSRDFPSGGETLACIGHPSGDYKRISFGNLAGSEPGFWQVRWFSGVTEEGSSGSPLLNANHEVVGQLYGGASACDFPSGVDSFDRFDLTYRAIKRWLLLQGTYYGLFQDPAGVAPQSAGSLRLTTTGNGKFTGQLQLGGTRYSMSGQLDETGNARITIPSKQWGTLSMQLQVDLTQGTDRLTGTISNQTWVATLAGDRDVFDGKTSMAPQAGRYTIVFPSNSALDAGPGGDSYGTLSVDKAGRIRFAGVLADGTRISRSSGLSKYGQWPLGLSLYGGDGLIQSWISFVGSPATALNGDLTWIKPTLPKAKLYSGGFTNRTTAVGSAYTRPLRGQRILDFSLGDLAFTGGNLPGELTNYFMLRTDNRVTNLSNTNKLKLTFALGSGAFTGSIAAPASSAPIKFGGVVLQNSNTGDGCFLGSSQSGRVSIQGLSP